MTSVQTKILHDEKKHIVVKKITELIRIASNNPNIDINKAKIKIGLCGDDFINNCYTVVITQ